MALQKKAITVSVFIIILCAIPTSIEARSVYAIPKHTGTTVNVYDVQGGAQEGQLEYRVVFSQLSVYFGLLKLLLLTS